MRVKVINHLKIHIYFDGCIHCKDCSSEVDFFQVKCILHSAEQVFAYLDHHAKSLKLICVTSSAWEQSYKHLRHWIYKGAKLQQETPGDKRLYIYILKKSSI